MKRKPYDLVLIKLAQISPKHMANAVRRRNRVLLRKLMLLEPYVGKRTRIPSSVITKVTGEEHRGCPHCKQLCVNCWWSDAVKDTCYAEDGYMFCVDVEFPSGFCLEDVNRSSSRTLQIIYCRNSEQIRVGSPHASIKDFEKCKAFLEDHIRWSRLKCWGEKYDA